MKKKNRKMAQQRRAQERKKQERKRKIRKFLAYFLPAAAVLILIFVLVFDGISSSRQAAASEEASSSEQDSSEDTSASEDEASAEEASDSSQETELSADSSLTVEDGDTVNIDYVGTIDGEEFSGGSTNGSGTDLVIGSGSYIDDFEEQLIGAHPGDEVSVEVTFPDDYSNQELQGQDAVFTVTINGIYR